MPTKQQDPGETIRQGSSILPTDPPPAIVSSSGWLMIVLFLMIATAALVVRIPETARYPFALIPTERADPIRAPYFSVVRQVHVTEGQEVGAGDELFLLFSEAIRAKHTEHQTLTEDLRALRERIRRAESAHESSLQMKAIDISQAQDELEFRERHVEVSRDIVTRGARVAESRGISQFEWARFELDLAESEKDLVIARKQLRSVRLELEAIHNERGRERRDEQAQVENLSSRIRALERDLENSSEDMLSIRAPYQGIVLSVAHGTVGDVVQAGEEILQLARIDAVPRVRITLDEAGLPRLAPDQRVQLFFDAYPYQRYGTVDARLDWISPAAVSTNAGQHFTALASLEDLGIYAKGEVRPLNIGLKGEARIHTGSRLLVDYAIEPLRQIRENLGR